MNSKCADCGHEECRCDSPPMPAASPWREERIETMTIIEDLRYAADNPDVFEHDYPSILRRIADRIERSGALVPVPDGEACGVWDAGFLRYFQCEHSGVWRLCGCTTNHMEPCDIKNISDGRIVELINNAPVQPVRLVPIAEAEL